MSSMPKMPNGVKSKRPKGTTSEPDFVAGSHPGGNLGTFLHPSKQTVEDPKMRMKSTNPLPVPPAGVRLPGVKSKAPKPRATAPPVSVAPMSQLIPQFGKSVTQTMPKMGTGNAKSMKGAKRGPSGMPGSMY
jgi:hypothetical protein